MFNRFQEGAVEVHRLCLISATGLDIVTGVLCVSLSPNFSFFSFLGLASQQQRLLPFWLSMSSKLFCLCVWVGGCGDLEYWVHAHVLCVLLGFGEDMCVCVRERDVNVRWNCFEFHYGDDLYFLIACDRFRMNSPSITWAEVASTVPIFVCTCPLSSEPPLPGFFGLFIYLLQCVKINLSMVWNYPLVLLLALNFPNFGILRYVGVIWFVFHILQLLPIRFTQ